MVQATVALRVDVDTRRGLVDGVPRLLELFRRSDVRASFFVTMGPDRSGLAIRRALRPAFLAKMWRTNPFRLYGLGTLLSGTLLPAPLVGAGVPELLRQIAAEGHEVAPHGWDHVGWQDGVHRWRAEGIRGDLARAAEAFREVFGTAPRATAAPGWRTTPEALRVQDESGYRYASDVRGRWPFHPIVDERPLRTFQVPTTLATVDELLGRVRDIPDAVCASVNPGLNVFTLHAEVEGGPFLGPFAGLLARLRRRGIAAGRLDEAVTSVDRAGARVERGRIPGRSGWVAVQGGSGKSARAGEAAVGSAAPRGETP